MDEHTLLKEFESFLKKQRKSSGEKYLPNTIRLYHNEIKKRIYKIMSFEDFDSTIEYFNGVIENNANIYVRTAFVNYLLFCGLPENDKRFKNIKSPKKMASAITSSRILGEKSINENDMKVLLSSVDSEWNLIISILYETGIRRAEFIGIRKKDITFVDDNNAIGAEIRVMGKGAKPRVVFIKKDTARKLKSLISEEDEDMKRVFVFRMKNGKEYVRQDKYLYDMIAKLTKEHIGKSYGVHSLRHSCAMKWANQGASINEIGSALGHASVQVSEVYVKTSKTQAKNMFERLNS